MLQAFSITQPWQEDTRKGKTAFVALRIFEVWKTNKKPAKAGCRGNIFTTMRKSS